MRVPDLALLLLLVSCLSLAFQVAALIRLIAHRATTPAEGLVSGGYVRTITCRVLAAVVYVVVAAIQLAGSGTLSAEALIVFSCIQILWQLNSLADIRISRRLSSEDSGTGRHRHAG